MPASRYKPFQTAGGAVDAVNVTSVPYSSMADTNVQRALEHLEDKAANAASNALNAQSSLTTVTATANAANATANQANTRALAANVTATAANITANGALQRTGGAMTGAITNLTVSGNATAANGVPSLSQVQDLIGVNNTSSAGAGGFLYSHGKTSVGINLDNIYGSTFGAFAYGQVGDPINTMYSINNIFGVYTKNQITVSGGIGDVYIVNFTNPMQNTNYKVYINNDGNNSTVYEYNKTINGFKFNFDVVGYGQRQINIQVLN